jgi:hypothetical protein
MQDFAEEFPTNKELLFYVADMFPADAVYPGRPYGDMTLKLLVFDYKHGQKCLGVMRINIALYPYCREEGRIVRDLDFDLGMMADFVIKWDSLERIEIPQGHIEPSCLLDRSFLAFLITANFATIRQVPDVETMRLPKKTIRARKIDNACKKYGVLKNGYHVLEQGMKCFKEAKVGVYLGDFEKCHNVYEWWLIREVATKTPSLLLDTVNNQVAICSSPWPVIKPLIEIFWWDKKKQEFDFNCHDKFFLCLIALALNSKYPLNS